MRPHEKRSTAEILLELLDKVPDAATLEVLLEPEHLHRLLRSEGWTDDAIREALAQGRAPGALLLEVLTREPDTAVLMRRLGDPPRRAPTTRTASSPVASTRSPASSAAHGAPAQAASHSSREVGRAVGKIAVGAIVALPSAWYLFVRLDVIHAPGLIEFFPQAYALLAALILAGIAMMTAGAWSLTRAVSQR